MSRKYLFVGNSVGIIRVFDIQNQTEKRCLVDNFIRLRVHSIFATDDGRYCVTGHNTGTIILWNLKTYCVAYQMNNLHSEKTTVVSAEIYFNDKNRINFVSSDQSGKVRKTEVKWVKKDKNQNIFVNRVNDEADDGKIYSH